MSEEPNYSIIELQAENENLRNALIESLKAQVKTLEERVAYLEGILTRRHYSEEQDVGSNMMAPPTFKSRPHIRTVSEISTILERRSLNSIELKKSAEDIKDAV